MCSLNQIFFITLHQHLMFKLKVNPTSREDLLDFSFANPVHASEYERNLYMNHKWVKYKNMDKFIFPYVLDIFKGKNLSLLE